MKRADQIARAERLRALHRGPKILVLPNIWDPLGARMLESLGYPAVATASAAVAASHGVEDGERLPLETVLDVISAIASAVSVPLTADFESGYAEEPDALAANVRRVIGAGAAGINIEDSRGDGHEMRTIEAQCARLRAVRAAAEAEAVPIVVNARVDVFGAPDGGPHDARIAEVVLRGRAYLEAGADCIYPIGPADADTARALRAGLDAPINLYLSARAAPIAELEAIGIARVSVGPGLLRASLAEMRRVATDLLEGRSYERFTTNAATRDEIRGYVTRPADGTTTGG